MQSERQHAYKYTKRFPMVTLYNFDDQPKETTVGEINYRHRATNRRIQSNATKETLSAGDAKHNNVLGYQN